MLTQPELPHALEALVEPTTRGDPESALRWTGQNVRRLAAELQEQGFHIERRKVADLLRELGYSLQADRKTREGRQRLHRNAQFEYIAVTVAAFQARELPAISSRYREERVGGRLQEPRTRVVSPRAAHPRPRARLCG